MVKKNKESLDINLKYSKYLQALRNISKGKIGKCCCAEEYALKVLEE